MNSKLENKENNIEKSFFSIFITTLQQFLLLNLAIKLR